MKPKRLAALLAASGLALTAQAADLLGVYRDALARLRHAVAALRTREN